MNKAYHRCLFTRLPAKAAKSEKKSFQRQRRLGLAAGKIFIDTATGGLAILSSGPTMFALMSFNSQYDIPWLIFVLIFTNVNFVVCFLGALKMLL